MIYRIYTQPKSKIKEISGVKVGPKKVVWVSTEKELDVDQLYEEGVYVKEVGEAPERDVDGNPVKVQPLKD